MHFYAHASLSAYVNVLKINVKKTVVYLQVITAK